MSSYFAEVFLLAYRLHEETVQVLTGLRGCAGSLYPLLFAYTTADLSSVTRIKKLNVNYIVTAVYVIGTWY